MPQGNRGWKSRVLSQLKNLEGFSGGINIHYSFDHEVARILPDGKNYKIRLYNGNFSTVKGQTDVIQLLTFVLKSVDKRKLQVFYG